MSMAALKEKRYEALAEIIGYGLEIYWRGICAEQRVQVRGYEVE